MPSQIFLVSSICTAFSVQGIKKKYWPVNIFNTVETDNKTTFNHSKYKNGNY